MTARIPSRSFFERPGSVRCQVLILILALVTTLCFSSGGSAQGTKGKKGSDPEKVTGTVTGIEKKGKSATLSIDKEDGTKLEVLITPRIKFSVTGTGDASLIQAKAVLSSEKIVKSNNEFFGHEFTLHLGPAPSVAVRRDPGGGDWFHVCGHVVSVGEKFVVLNFGAAGGTQKVMFEEGTELELTVIASDPDLVVEGSKVELEGTAKGPKFIPSKVTVTLEKALTADDLQAAGNDKKSGKAKTAASTKGNKKPGKAKPNDPDGDSESSTADPFGVLGKKDGKETGSTGGDKSPPEKK